MSDFDDRDVKRVLREVSVSSRLRLEYTCGGTALDLGFWFFLLVLLIVVLIVL